jgi:hypothetical protein
LLSVNASKRVLASRVEYVNIYVFCYGRGA